jgi:hypothetical protein
MMPLKLINQIKREQLNAGSDKWTSRSSGNLLELLVLPQYVHNKKAFRCAVISAGQALAALKTEYNKAGKEIFIQTFPHIENPRVICSIRFDDIGYSKSDLAPEPVIFEKKCPDIDAYLHKTAQHFHLCTQSAYLNEEALKLINSDSTTLSHTYLLVSSLDNPFIWLNVGYWKEAVTQYMRLHETNKKYFLYHFSHQRDDFKKYTDLKNGTYLQGFIGF